MNFGGLDLKVPTLCPPSGSHMGAPIFFSLLFFVARDASHRRKPLTYMYAHSHFEHTSIWAPPKNWVGKDWQDHHALLSTNTIAYHQKNPRWFLVLHGHGTATRGIHERGWYALGVWKRKGKLHLLALSRSARLSSSSWVEYILLKG